MIPPTQRLPASASALAACLLVGAAAVCPKGFGEPGHFPQEWKIPVWPEQSPEAAAKLRTVSLAGFKTEALNEEFLEGPGAEFEVQGRETYWQVSGEYFLFYCQRFRKWRVAGIAAFGKNRDGDCFGFVSDGVAGRDVQDPSLIKGWIEVEGGAWQRRKEAGVSALGTLNDQLDALDAAECDASEGAECGAGDQEAAHVHGQKTNCPVMPTVRKVGAKITQVARQAGKWLKRLFPSLLPAPAEGGEDGEL